MIYIESESRDPYFNLALEEYVFEQMDRSQEYFILWQNANTIVVGKYQNTAEEINPAFVDKNEIKVARRLSGGGAVYHDDGNLNYTFIVDQKGDDEDLLDFENFARPVIKTLKEMGIDAAFTGRNDILIDGKKISGSSQYVKKGRILNHGCIMLDSNLTNVTDALRPKEAKFQSKSVKSVRSRVTTINANLPEPISMETFKKKLVDQILNGEDIRRYALTEADYAAIEILRKEKYATWEWNYGKGAVYQYKREKKFDFGMVSIHGEIEDGIIQEIRIYGDFFGNGEIADLEECIIGERLDQDFATRLEAKIDLGHYIKGMTAKDLDDLLR